MVSLFYTLSFAASLVSSVAAHGTVMGLEINGKSYRATDVNRGNRNQNPLHRTSGDSLICNNGGKTSTKSSAKASPGDEITFQWEWTSDRHPGPIETELAFCGDEDDSCNGFSATGNVWFKIQETGVLEDSTDFDGGNWASDKLKIDGNTWKITLPQGLKKGAYIMRHNIVAMHLVKKPEFYPSCTHLVVGGSGTGVPPSSSLFAIPGYLSDPESQKALDFNIFSRYKKDQFKLAGPRPVTSFFDPGPDPVDPTTSEADPTSTETNPATTEGPASTTTITMTRTQKGTKTAAAPTPTETLDDLPECPEDPDVPEDDYSSSAPASASAAPTASPTEDLPPCPSSSEVPEVEEHDEYKRDYTESLASGVDAVRQVLRRMNSRHGKRRIAEWH